MQDDLPKTAANHVPLSPVSFLPRAAHVWGKRVAIIHGARRITYAQFLDRSRRLASALRGAGIQPGDVVAVAKVDGARAAEQMLGSPLVKIETMGSYSCRNIAGSEQRSAHARAEAIDVSAFVLADGRRIVLKRDWQGGDAATREFLRVVHKSACKRFGTVLGPEYNAAHEDHFHLEGTGAKFCR